jgi:hypothetical protein
MRKCAPLLRLRARSIACALLLVSSAPAFARTYYVSPDGLDSHSGSQSSPWLTLFKAAKTLKPGDTVLIADGTYQGGVRQSRPGLPGRPITYKAINAGKVILRGDQTEEREVFTVMETEYIVVDGLTATRGDRVGFWVAASDHVTIRNCRALRNGVTGIFTSFSNDLLIEHNICAYSEEQHGIYVSNSGDRPTVRYNICHNNARCGIQLNGDGKQLRPSLGLGGDGIIENALIEGNVLYENGQTNAGAALNLACVCNSTITNNLVYNNEAGGISLFNDNRQSAVEYGSKNNLILHNTVYFKAGEGRWCLSFTNGSTGNLVGNNLLTGGYRGAYQFDDTSSFVSDYNLIRSAADVGVAVNRDLQQFYSMSEWRALSGNDMHSATMTPKYVSPTVAPFDFHLAAGSPALNRGASCGEVAIDIVGMFRDPQNPNIGCFEGFRKPAAPVDVEGQVQAASGDVSLTWTSPTSGATFIVKRAKTQGGLYTVVASGLKKKAWVDTTAKSGETYLYRIVAVSGGVDSAASKPISVVVP